MSEFAAGFARAHAVDGPAIELGGGVHDGALAPGASVRVPLAMMPRRGGGELGDLLTSGQGKQLQKEVMRGVFGMLRKRL